jgi:hypothetical protein
MATAKIHVMQKNGARPPQQRVKRPATSLKIREAGFDDYAAINALHVRNGLITRPFDEWVSLWKGNPVFERSKRSWPIGWVLEADGGAIVGAIGNIPMAYHFRGRELRAAAACSWAVDSRYRGYSMLMLDKLTRQPGADLTLSTTVSPSAEPAFKVFHWSKPPVGAWDKSAFWITGYRGFGNSFLNMKAVPLAKVISYPVSAALFCWDRLVVDEAQDDGPNAGLEQRFAFDASFDRFWEELKLENAGLLLAERSRDTLNWHFGAKLAKRDAWILTASKGSRLTAYAIFDRQDNIAYGLKRVRLVDFQALKGSENALMGALCRMLHKCRDEGVHIVENVGCWLDRPGLPKAGAPYHRTLPSSMFYYNSCDKSLSETLRDPAVWAPSSLDGDASL